MIERCTRRPGRRWAPALLSLAILSELFAPAHPVAAATPEGQASLPAPWTSTDIGNPALAGSATFGGGTFEVTGGGVDVWQASDQLHFAYQAISGDVDIVARVAQLRQGDTWSKAGVMIRASLSPDAANGFMLMTAARLWGFQRRPSAGAYTKSTEGCLCDPPGWVRLVRTGDTFSAYESLDAVNWRLVGRDDIAMPSTVYVGLAVTSHNGGTTAAAVFTDVALNASVESPRGSLPSPWSAGDIGSPALAGSTASDGQTFTMSAGGADVWETADQFQFAYQQVTGDTQIVARVNSIQAVDQWTKAGVMVRGSLSSSSANAAMFGTGWGGLDFQRRLSGGAFSVWNPGSGTTGPVWVRLVREGNLFTGYESADGVNWTLVGVDVIPMPATVYIGLALTAHNPNYVAGATFGSVSVTAPGRSNKPPSVTLSASVVRTGSGPANIVMTAAAGDPDGSVVRVDFYQNGQFVASSATAPFGATWSNVPVGAYTLAAVAVDNDGAFTVSAPVVVTVDAIQSPPKPTTVVFVPPIDYATNVTSLSVELRRASDPVSAGAVASTGLGKPGVAGNEISVTISSIVDPLPAGSYYAVIVSVGPGGSTTSAPSATFSK